MDKCAASDIAPAKKVLASLVAGMLLLADRNFFNFQLWNLARATGADLLWRVKTGARLPREKVLSDGSYLSHVYPSKKDRRNNAVSDEAGHAFQEEAGHRFRFEAGRGSDLKPATPVRFRRSKG